MARRPRVTVTEESETGRNLRFHDNRTGQDMTRAGFVREIERGNYPDYHIRKVNSIRTPISNPNRTESDNLG